MALLWSLFIVCGMSLTFLFGVLRGHDEEHHRCRHEFSEDHRG